MSCFNSAEEIGHNQDILIQILLNLPTKSLIRFKLVSKQWMSLISSCSFCLAHTRSLHTKASLKPSALFLGEIHFPDKGFRFLPLTHDCVRLPCFDFTGNLVFQLLQSCNGLLLCYSGKYFICNPITRKCKMLSIPSHPCYRVAGVSLAFDPLESPHHKVISVNRHICNRGKYFIEIYSSETNSWSSSKVDFTWNGSMEEFYHGVFFKGAIYWDSVLPELLYLDVENDCLKTMPNYWLSNRFRYLGESGGYLNLALAFNPPCNSFYVLEMVEDRSGWCLKHSLSYNDLSPIPRYFSDPIQLFCAIQSEEGDSIFIVGVDGSAISINFKDRAIKELHRCPNSYTSGLYDRFRGFQYIETLSCIL